VNEAQANPTEPEFDQYANDYEALVERSLAPSGEGPSYFARRRAEFLAKRLAELGVRPETVLDFGCGTGGAVPHLLDVLGAGHVIGVDPSEKSLEVARRRHAGRRATFVLPFARSQAGDVDVAYCNGVFHHIPPPDRAGAVDYVYRSLRSGGVFSFWEHNPFNPGTRYSMYRCPFDEDAITLTPAEARRLLRSAGFRVLRTDHLFIFPRFLKPLRGLEALVTKLPLGGQYEILCRK
jgi:SAM-dependent methyltransferase